MSLSDSPQIVRIYEATSRDAAIRLAARDGYAMAQQGYEVSGARWSPPEMSPPEDGPAVRRAVATIARVLLRRGLPDRSTGMLIVTWTHTVAGTAEG